MSIHIKTFVCNPYQENTYVLYDETGSGVIIDPGMYDSAEGTEVLTFIKDNNIHLELLLNTHCHIDHVLGNKLIYDTYTLLPNFNEKEIPLYAEIQSYAPQMGIRYEVSPISETFLPESGSIEFGNHSLELIFAPGHSPGHLCFYNKDQGFLIGGDVLFKGSIGRTDLPGGDHDQLIQSIVKNVYVLPDETIVYPGHGPATTVGQEKRANPFVRG